MEVTCDNVAFLKDGEVVAAKDLRTLGESEIHVVVRARKLSASVVAGLGTWTTAGNLEGEQLTMTARSSEVLPDVLRYLTSSGADIYSFVPERASLEDLFVRIMGEDRGL